MKSYYIYYKSKALYRMRFKMIGCMFTYRMFYLVCNRKHKRFSLLLWYQGYIGNQTCFTMNKLQKTCSMELEQDLYKKNGS